MALTPCPRIDQRPGHVPLRLLRISGTPNDAPAYSLRAETLRLPLRREDRHALIARLRRPANRICEAVRNSEVRLQADQELAGSENEICGAQDK